MKMMTRIQMIPPAHMRQAALLTWCVAAVLMLAIINPLLCLIHCHILHSQHERALVAPLCHTLPGTVTTATAPTTDTLVAPHERMVPLPERVMPRAVYELLLPVALLLVLVPRRSPRRIARHQRRPTWSVLPPLPPPRRITYTWPCP